MKLRIKGNSIRLRLTRSEVATIGEGGRVAETVMFAPDKTLTYAIEAADVAAPVADFANDQIRICLPKSSATAWAAGDEIGIGAENQIGDNARLCLAIEKDFSCLSSRGEEDADTFDNPLSGHAKC